MKKLFITSIYLWISFAGCFAQKPELTTTYKTATVNSVCQLLEDYYVFPEKAKETSVYLQQLSANGAFKGITDLPRFSEKLTNEIYAVTKDKHLVVREISPVDMNPTELDDVQIRLQRNFYARSTNAGFKAIQKLDNNIGYLNLRSFYGLEIGKSFADNAMSLLATSDAIIIDLRENSGGRGDMVEYLLAHFFSEPIIASKSTKRSGDRFIERINKTPQLPKEKLMPNVPLFVLTSSKSISAAEGFSFPLQIYDRATFIGETTAGAANPGDIIPVNEDLQIFVSDVSITHPENGRSWEGIGIIPDIKTEADKALEVAVEEAAKAANTYRLITEKKAKETYDNLENAITEFEEHRDANLIIQGYLTCHKYGLYFSEYEINSRGYELMESPDKINLAEAILKANTLLYPESPNVYDSYGDALFASNKLEEAYENYQKAVDIGSQTQDANLQLFKDNLQKTAKEMGLKEQEDAAIKNTLLNYINGTANGEPKRLQQAFHPDFNLYTVDENNNLVVRDGQKYINLFKEGKKSNRKGKVLSIDYENNAATAKVEILMSGDKRYVDYFLLLKYNGAWKIVQKSYTRTN